MKTIILDIGTHEAQELRVLSGDKRYALLTYLKWWYDWAKRQVKKVIKHPGIIKYGEGAYKKSPASYTLREHLDFLGRFSSPRNFLREFEIIAVDPVAKITTKFLKRVKAKSSFLPVAILPHDASEDRIITKFYIESDSLSSSLSYSTSYKELILCSAMSCKFLLEQFLKHGLIANDSQIILRMNCEGVEFAIIRDLLSLGFKPKLVMGSINDVRKKYGEEEAKKLNQLLIDHKIDFHYFKGSDPSTWFAAFKDFTSL